MSQGWLGLLQARKLGDEVLLPLMPSAQLRPAPHKARLFTLLHVQNDVAAA